MGSVDEISELARAAAAVHALRAIPPHERRALRADAGVSRSVLAELLDVSPDRIKGYEEGATPAGESAHRYHQALLAMTPPAAEEPLTEDAKAQLAQYFSAGEVCAHCKGIHVRACPRVKKMAYHESGTLAEVEFWPDGKWPTDNVVFPDSPEMTE